MDSLTQIALGAAVGEAVIGRQVGRKAVFYGAVLGTLPDLDVFFPMGDAVRDFTMHRSYSHSLIVLTLLSPLITWLLLRLHPGDAHHRKRWLAMVFLVLVTHTLLDAMTVYGTQLLWPLTDYPFGVGSIFIIDPAYTLPLIIGVLAALILSRRQALGHRWNAVGLVVSSLYLAWTVAAQWHMTQLARQDLADAGIRYEKLLVQPTPFNSILWRTVAMGDGQYHEGYRSLAVPDDHFQMRAYTTEPALLDGITAYDPVRRLLRFSKGFSSVGSNPDGDIIISDLRMGLEPDYVFRFVVGRIANPHAEPAPVVELENRRRLDLLPALWRRIWRGESLPAPGSDG